MTNAENELIKGAAEYEAMSSADLKERYSDVELKRILKEAFGLASAVYFITKTDKIRYITEPDEREEILAGADERQKAHRARNKEQRESGQSVSEKTAEQTEGQTFRYIGSERVEDGFQDDINGRRGKVAYIIEEVGDGTQMQVTKGTANALRELERLEGFDPKTTRGRKSVAHEAGEKTLADHQEAETSDEPDEAEGGGNSSGEDDDGDEDLDALLDQIPS